MPSVQTSATSLQLKTPMCLLQLHLGSVLVAIRHLKFNPSEPRMYGSGSIRLIAAKWKGKSKVGLLFPQFERLSEEFKHEHSKEPESQPRTLSYQSMFVLLVRRPQQELVN